MIKFNKNITDKLTIKGLLSNDGKTIEYESGTGDDKHMAIITIEKCFSKFAGNPIELSIALKDIEDLTEEFEEEDE